MAKSEGGKRKCFVCAARKSCKVSAARCRSVVGAQPRGQVGAGGLLAPFSNGLRAAVCCCPSWALSCARAAQASSVSFTTIPSSCSNPPSLSFCKSAPDLTQFGSCSLPKGQGCSQRCLQPAGCSLETLFSPCPAPWAFNYGLQFEHCLVLGAVPGACRQPAPSSAKGTWRLSTGTQHLARGQTSRKTLGIFFCSLLLR